MQPEWTERKGHYKLDLGNGVELRVDPVYQTLPGRYQGESPVTIQTGDYKFTAMGFESTKVFDTEYEAQRAAVLKAIEIAQHVLEALK